jgi:hypothetical protein
LSGIALLCYISATVLGDEVLLWERLVAATPRRRSTTSVAAH